MCVTNLFGGGSSSPSLPPPPPPPPAVVDTTKDNAASLAARAAEQKRAMLAKGMGSTILTSALGDTSKANVQKASLLGQTSSA